MSQFGKIVLMGSGETSQTGGQLFEAVVRESGKTPKISILETPAGFELNSDRVAGRVRDYLEIRLQNYAPEIHLVPARERDGEFSTESISVCASLLDSDLIYMGAGSPTYAVRNLLGSLAYKIILAAHQQGAALVFASAATIAIGEFALPVYEIYKVGEPPEWKPGLNLLGQFGLRLAIIPHWNNAEGGSELDTRRCFIGEKRFTRLQQALSPDVTVLGLDEHTGMIIDIDTARATVVGKDGVHIIRKGSDLHFTNGEVFGLDELGPFSVSIQSALEANDEIANLVKKNRDASKLAPVVPDEIYLLVEQREEARRARDWALSDALRQRIKDLGWQVNDTSGGPEVTPN